MDIANMVNYMGFVIGILGIILSIYLYKKGLETKDPRCYYKTLRNISKLSDDDNSKIRIFYDQEEVSRVYTTQVWIWNNGKKPINKIDIPPQSELKIKLNDKEFNPKILDYEIVKTSRSEINFSVSPHDETTLVIGFDFLDQNDGAIVEIQHTGSKETELSVEGVILGVPEGLKLIETKKKNNLLTKILLLGYSILDIRRNPRFLIAFTFTLIFISIGLLIWSYYDMKNNLTVSVSTSNLQEVLMEEFPQATKESISNIMEKISRMAIVAHQISMALMAAYVMILSGPLVYMIWKMRTTPYPKILKIDDEFGKNQKTG